MKNYIKCFAYYNSIYNRYIIIQSSSSLDFPHSHKLKSLMKCEKTHVLISESTHKKIWSHINPLFRRSFFFSLPILRDFFLKTRNVTYKRVRNERFLFIESFFSASFRQFFSIATQNKSKCLPNELVIRGQKRGSFSLESRYGAGG